jgi:hypothetical protein
MASSTSTAMDTGSFADLSRTHLILVLTGMVLTLLTATMALYIKGISPVGEQPFRQVASIVVNLNRLQAQRVTDPF